MNYDDDEINELKELLDTYESAKEENRRIYLDADQIADIANWYIGEKQYTEAQQAIDYGMHLHPENIKLQLEQVLLHIEACNFKEAHKAMNIIKDIEMPEVKILKAEIAMNEGKLDEACQHIDSIDFADKPDDEIIENIIRLYIGMGFAIKSYSWLKGVINHYGHTITLDEFLAYTCFHCRGKITEAIDIYNSLIDRDPYNAKYWTDLAKCYFHEEKYEQALDAIDFALTANKYYGEAYSVKANTFLQLNETEEAIKLYEEAIAYDGIAPYFAYVFLGLTFVNEQNWSKGVVFLEKALSNLPSEDDPGVILYSGIYSNLSLAYCKEGNYEKAGEMAEISLELEPESPHTHIVIGLIFLSQGEMESAERAFNDALKLDNSNDTILQAGDHSYDHCYYSYAKKLFEEIYNRDPNYPGINQRLAAISLAYLDAESFCKYNEQLEVPILLESITPQYLKEEDADSIEAFNKFIEEIKYRQGLNN